MSGFILKGTIGPSEYEDTVFMVLIAIILILALVGLPISCFIHESKCHNQIKRVRLLEVINHSGGGCSGGHRTGIYENVETGERGETYNPLGKEGEIISIKARVCD